MARHREPEASPALELRGLTKYFGGGALATRLTGQSRVTALDGLDLTVERGTVHALLGPNGAGKTTTVRAVATLLRPDSGSVQICGIDALADPDAVRSIIGLSGQYAAVDGNLTGFENLRMVAQLYGHSRRESSSRARGLITDLGLTEAADRPMLTYSGGMRRRLDLAGALINRPEVVILDEPTTGLDPRGRRQIWDIIADQVKSGTTVLLTTQYLEEADTLADTITVIDGGKVRAQGTAAELKATAAQSTLTVTLAPENSPAAGSTRDELVTSALTDVGLDAPRRLEDNRWSVPVADGSRSTVAAVSACTAAGIDVVDATVASPTLDDAFLHLTGRTPPPEPQLATTAGGTR